MRKKWVAVTAGFGSEDFHGAAKRVAGDLRKLNIFDQVFSLTRVDYKEFSPLTFAKYRHFFNAETKGFGFMAWKSEIVHSVLSGAFGKYENVVWIDAGCEISTAQLAIKRFHKFLEKAELNGVFGFTLDTKEFEYSKTLLTNLFPGVALESPQIQTTWLVLSGSRGRKIAEEWLRYTLEDFRYLDLSTSEEDKSNGLIENRNDQSIFSLVCKSMGYYGSSYVPPSGRGGTLSQIRALGHPIWTSRNRTPITIKRPWVSGIERFL